MQGCDYQSIVQATDKIFHCPSILHTCQCSRRSALLLGPGRNHAVAARVRDRLPQMLVLIFENVHQRVLLRPVSSEQFHRRLQVVVGKCRNRFLQIDVRSLQGFLHFLRIGDGRGRCPLIRRARKHAGEQAVLFNDQVEDLGDGANALGGTRASPVNLSESVPASFAKAACNPAGCDCARANGTIRATESAHTAY